MGSFIGGLVTKKKRKKLNNAIQDEYDLQTEKALANADLEREAQRVGQVRANVQMSQERIAGAREARIRRAEIVSAANNAGAGTSTASQYGAGSIYTQFVSSLGQQNIFAGFAQELSRLQEESSNNQSDIISSQGRQTALNASLAKQQEKANLIGGAIDLGLTVATGFAGPTAFGALGGAGMFSGTAAKVAQGSSTLWGSSGGSTIFNRFF